MRAGSLPKSRRAASKVKLSPNGVTAKNRNVQFDIEDFIGPGESFAVHRIAKNFVCSVQHIRNLIEEGSIQIPPEEIALARSGKKTWTTVRVPRKSFIDFVRLRSSRGYWNAERKNARKLRAKGSE